MALTRPRAYQIYDIDYKQAVRVITLINIVLSGGAPNSVDSVNLSVNDRVLVAGQTNPAQNGIYYVTVVGTGSNGTWVRSIDTDTTGELLAGTIVMVTEGVVYQDTQWKLTTDDPIVIGTTPLVFAQNSAFAFGNVYANGTAVLATTVGDVLTLTAGNNISLTGNNTSKTVNIAVTGISANAITFGTSNVQIPESNGNIRINVGGTSNVAVFSTAAANITGNLEVTGNITGSYVLGNGSLLTGIDATSIQSGTSNVRVQSSGGNISVGVGGSAILRFTTAGIVNDMGNGVGNIGNATGYFNTAFVKSTSAQYADLAEYYAGDQDYSAGTVVIFGGTAEVTESTSAADYNVAGVVSSNPAYIMNAAITAAHAVPVALAGRVPTKVVGPVRKGNMMVSAPNGHAQACATPAVGTVIGKAIEDFDGEHGTIEIVVGRL